MSEIHLDRLVVLQRLHEEVAALRRLTGIYEDALDEILDVADGDAGRIAHEALYVGGVDKGDENREDGSNLFYEGDPGDETDA